MLSPATWSEPAFSSRLQKATREYNRLRDIRKEVAAAIIAERLEGTPIEEIARLSPYKQTQVNRILKAAGLVTPRSAES